MTAGISLKALLAFLAVQLVIASNSKPHYPELRSDLQRYQDSSKCYPDVGEWYLMYRNYYADPLFGGTESCVKYNRYGDYANFSTPAVFTYGQDGFLKGKLTLSSTPCYTGKNKKEFVSFESYGCSYWRRVDTLDDTADSCDFIYDENCGTSPKYKMYDSSCTFGDPTDMAGESGTSDSSDTSESSDTSGSPGSSDSSGSPGSSDSSGSTGSSDGSSSKSRRGHKGFKPLEEVRNSTISKWAVAMTARISLKVLLAFLAVQLVTASSSKPRYPELRSDLQRYQDSSKCYPDVGEWYLMYRNYHAESIFGGTESCVKYSRYGDYANFSAPVVYTYGQDGFLKGKLTLSSTQCYTGKNKEEFVPYESYGCTYWRRVDTLDDSADCCDFIYDQNCGTSPKYKMYDSTCTFGEPSDMAGESGISDSSDGSDSSDNSGSPGSSDSSDSTGSPGSSDSSDSTGSPGSSDSSDSTGSSDSSPESSLGHKSFRPFEECYPEIGEWYLMYRNYEVDADFGGTAKCVKYSRYGSYGNFSTSAMFTFGRDGYM
ncbi:hypothetical protein MTO96_014740 [Rhipicephalus appendiculatus]